MTFKVKIATINVRGLRDNIKRRETLNWLKKYNIQVALLQETHTDKKIEHLWQAEWGGKVYFSHGTTQARGTAIFIDKDLDFKVLEVNEGRWLIIRANLNSQRVTIMNVYAPNSDTPEFFLATFEAAEEMGEARKIIAGDFNLVMDNALDRSQGQHKNIKSQKIVKELAEHLDLLDLWREIHPEQPGFTWKRYRPTYLAERLDFFLVTEEMAQFVVNMAVRPSHKSDHSIVLMELAFEIEQRGPGYWKLNCALLQDKEYVSSINQLIEIELEQSCYKSKKQQWENLKFAIQDNMPLGRN